VGNAERECRIELMRIYWMRPIAAEAAVNYMLPATRPLRTGAHWAGKHGLRLPDCDSIIVRIFE